MPRPPRPFPRQDPLSIDVYNEMLNEGLCTVHDRMLIVSKITFQHIENAPKKPSICRLVIQKICNFLRS
jgi:hypothetical protein